MLRLSLVARIAVAGMLMTSGTIYGQAGGTCEAGGGTGGGGAAGDGAPGTSSRSGFSGFGLLNQLAQANQTQQQNQEAAALAARETQLQNSTERFIERALTFDSNNDRQFDREELNEVAAAVIAELRTRQAPTRQSRRRSRRSRVTRQSEDDDPETTQRRQETFVARAMSLDCDDDGALDSFES